MTMSVLNMNREKKNNNIKLLKKQGKKYQIWLVIVWESRKY